ncbi:MAG: hypothetical protein Q9219_004850 [cf. Caloplaca sp. 3 TL-2023]
MALSYTARNNKCPSRAGSITILPGTSGDRKLRSASSPTTRIPLCGEDLRYNSLSAPSLLDPKKMLHLPPSIRNHRQSMIPLQVPMTRGMGLMQIHVPDEGPNKNVGLIIHCPQRRPAARMLTLSMVSPEDYANLIHIHAKRSTTTTLFPGPNYINLSTWLQPRKCTEEGSLSEKVDRHCLAVFYDLTVLRKPGRASYLYQTDLDQLPKVKSTSQGLRPGTTPPGLPFAGLDQRYWRQVSTGSGVHPSPSRLLHIFAGTRDVRFPGACIIIEQHCPAHDTFRPLRKRVNVHAKRRTEAEEMTTYRRRFQVQQKCGDSIVREFSTLNDELAVLSRTSQYAYKDAERVG